MSNFFQRLGYIITGMNAVIFVLVMTIIGMIFLSHGLYLQIFSKVMEPWHATVASWTLALGWECTVLVTTCNVKYVNRKLPMFLAICSGLIVLFFIKGFDSNQSILELLMRWFLSGIVAIINFVFSELFYSKWKENIQEHETLNQLEKLRMKYDELLLDLGKSQSDLNDARSEIEQNSLQLKELEAFRDQQYAALTCPICGMRFSSVYKMAAHKAQCNKTKESKNGIEFVKLLEERG